MVNEEMQSQGEGFSSLVQMLGLWSCLTMDPQGRMGTRKLSGRPSSSLPREYRWMSRAQVRREMVMCQWEHEEEEE